MTAKRENLALQGIEQAIHTIRGQRVILDADLARLYGVPTHRLNEQVRRNIARFPKDFMFQLSDQEVTLLRSQNAISNKTRGGRRYAPYCFTEHGAVMAANVLSSPAALIEAVKELMTHPVPIKRSRIGF